MGAMTAAEIQAPTTVPCGAGTLTFGEHGDVTVEGMDASATVAIPEIRKGDYVHVWCGRDWACFLTEDGPTVWCAWPEKGRSCTRWASPESLRRANSHGRPFTINFRHALNVSTKLRYGFRVRASPLDSVSTTEASLRKHPEAPRTASRRSLCE